MAECDWIVLCDYAFTDAHQKLCMIGIFDTVSAAAVPVKHGRCAIGFSILGEPGESAKVAIEIIQPSGSVHSRIELENTLPDSGSAQGYVEFRDIVFGEFGRYAIQLEPVDGAPKAVWFTLTQRLGA